MARPFRDRIAESSAVKKSRIILALDPPASVHDIMAFAEKTIAQVQEHVCAIKLNFHVILPLSRTELASINKLAHSYGLQAIADIKLNDIENTNDVAVDHLVGKMGFDCVIANPFIGSEGFESLVRKAHALDGGLIALVYMSHKGAREGYGLRVEGGRDLYKIFLDRASGAGADGIVVGASNLEILKELSSRGIPVYSPGIGAQGADAEAAARAGAHYLIVGRSIIESKEPAVAARDLKMRISSVARS